jgi:hypothetical protein
VPAGNNVTLDKWQQPLSVAVSVAKAQLGNSFVPFDTAQAAPAGISGMAWFMPLGMAAGSIPTAAQGAFYVPFDTAQVAPPVDIPLPPVVGGGGPDHRIASRTWRYKSTTRPVYVRAFAKVRRDLARAEEQLAEQIRAAKPEPARELKPKFFEPIEMALSRLGLPSGLFDRVEAQRKLDAQAFLELKRKRDDEEAVALLLLT